MGVSSFTSFHSLHSYTTLYLIIIIINIWISSTVCLCLVF